MSHKARGLREEGPRAFAGRIWFSPCARALRKRFSVGHERVDRDMAAWQALLHL